VAKTERGKREIGKGNKHTAGRGVAGKQRTKVSMKRKRKEGKDVDEDEL